jgi:hypothetical protein
VEQYYRLFMMPAVAHCGGSTGPSSIGGGAPEPPAAYRDADHHVVSAVIKWVEQGVAPEKLVARASTQRQSDAVRVLCAHILRRPRTMARAISTTRLNFSLRDAEVAGADDQRRR